MAYMIKRWQRKIESIEQNEEMGHVGHQKGDSKYQNGHLLVSDMWKKWLLRNRKEKKIRKLGKNQTPTKESSSRVMRAWDRIMPPRKFMKMASYLYEFLTTIHRAISLTYTAFWRSK